MAKVNPVVSAIADIFSHPVKRAGQPHLTSTDDLPGKTVTAGGRTGLRVWSVYPAAPAPVRRPCALTGQSRVIVPWAYGGRRSSALPACSANRLAAEWLMPADAGFWLRSGRPSYFALSCRIVAPILFCFVVLLQATTLANR